MDQRRKFFENEEKKKLCETQAPSTVNTKVSWRDFFFFPSKKQERAFFEIIFLSSENC